VDRKKVSEADKSNEPTAALTDRQTAVVNEAQRKNGGWREIEARREKAALKASLADVWDEDFDLDEEILAELDHTAEFFRPQDDAEEEAFDEDDEVDEFFEDDEISPSLRP
jgi:hypothetical protein